jgi:hypothetical protein
MIKSLKSLFITLCMALSLVASQGYAAGTLPLAMAQQIDVNGQPLAGCQLTFFVAGTASTPQNNYADFGLTQAQSNPLSCDQSGRIPMFWLADGLIHVRLTDSSGLPIIDTTMQVLGPSSGGGGGGGTVDPTTIIATVSGGRSGNALNDFNAGKQLTLVDLRGRAPIGLGDMGNSATTALLSTYFGNSPTTLGAAGGSQGAQLAVTNLPPHQHGFSGTTGNDSPDHTHGVVGNTGTESANHTHSLPAFMQNSGLTAQANPGAVIGGTPTSGSTGNESATHTHPINFASQGASARHQHPFSGSTDNGLGGSTPVPVVTPSMVMTFYMKL